jgi:hypothetical protein
MTNTPSLPFEITILALELQPIYQGNGIDGVLDGQLQEMLLELLDQSPNRISVPKRTVYKSVDEGYFLY